MISPVGMVGLGLMGSAIATRLLEEGFSVRGHDRDPERVAQFASRGGVRCGSIAEAVGGVEVVLLSLPNGSAVREVCLGAGGLLESARPGLIVVDTTTSAPHEVEEVAAALAAGGIGYLDVTVSGTSAMVARRDLIAIVGGNAGHYERVGPIVDGFARARHHVGPVGAATKTKLVINLIVGANRVVLAEALVLAERAGLDHESLLAVLKDSVAASKVIDVYGDRLVSGDHESPVSRLASHAKTIDLILEFGREVGAPLWMTSVVSKLLLAAKMEGLAQADSTASIEVLRRMAAAGSAPG